MIRLLPEIAKKPLDFFDNMKLQGITLPASFAVSTPTIVPEGAFSATVKLLIVIVMTSPVWQRTDAAASLLNGETGIDPMFMDIAIA